MAKSRETTQLTGVYRYMFKINITYMFSIASLSNFTHWLCLSVLSTCSFNKFLLKAILHICPSASFVFCLRKINGLLQYLHFGWEIFLYFFATTHVVYAFKICFVSFENRKLNMFYLMGKFVIILKKSYTYTNNNRPLNSNDVEALLKLTLLFSDRNTNIYLYMYKKPC